MLMLVRAWACASSAVGSASTIAQNEAHTVRVRWLIDSFKSNEFAGTYLGVGSAPSRSVASNPGYTKALATEVSPRIPTDLDAFSDAEAAVLENHGYWLTDAALCKHVPDLVEAGAPPPRAPHADWMDETKMRAALRDSSHRRVPFGRKG